jgi:hypothetical protein
VQRFDHFNDQNLRDTDREENFMSRLLPTLAFAVLASTAAMADRALTEVEREKVVAALQAEGCTGGDMEFDDGKFEVDDARCADGKKYDFEFDVSFKTTKRELDD